MAGQDSKVYVIGLMSGTSMDGIDACLLEITAVGDLHSSEAIPRWTLVSFLTHPYPVGLKGDLMRICSNGTIGELCGYNVLLGKLFAEAAKAVARAGRLEMGKVALIGSHGQTVHHMPAPQSLYGYQITSTLQIGDPSIIANECGITTVGDFRLADMAVGGQGAPLVPYLDQTLLERYYREKKRAGMLLNIGGISNISAYVPPTQGKERDFVGFDCGPGNVLVDHLMKQLYGVEYDKDGKIGFLGKISSTLLQELHDKDTFVPRCPPKSTGREYYDHSYVERIMALGKTLNLSTEDLIATVTDFTAAAVCANYEQFIKPLIASADEVDLFVSGGGAKNNFLMRRLQERLNGVEVYSAEKLGLNPDAKEAVCFALLGYETYRGRPGNVPSATGAAKKVILGKICPVYQQHLPKAST